MFTTAKQPGRRQRGYRPPLEHQRAILEHIRYERNMLLGAAFLLGQHPVTDTSSNDVRALHNALLESFLLHARNLRDFLFKRVDDNALETDVLARDFFADPAEWHQRRPKSEHLKAGIGGLNDQAGKHVAHLSYARVGTAPYPPAWQHVEIAAAITSALDMWACLAKA